MRALSMGKRRQQMRRTKACRPAFPFKGVRARTSKPSLHLIIGTNLSLNLGVEASITEADENLPCRVIAFIHGHRFT
ncbi:hypothetical protein OPV22_009447 [Ensete ventricosum]|uniref:Uncharacterized protein n=1 Tax=Ensete ventricosum TaxID=4639 RepID=A0AAV8PRH5_ENSVE|nr:hypothetical protein OPV22_009447 [Ensete ventricosum]